MIDRSRMDRMLDAVREVWEGQPDLDFAALMGMLSTHGLTWGISDDDAQDICMTIATTYPGTLSKVTGQYSVLLANNTTAVLTPERIALLRGWQQPIWWCYASLVQAQVGSPLIVADREGIEHRLDAIRRIEKTMLVDDTDTRVIELADAPWSFKEAIKRVILCVGVVRWRPMNIGSRRRGCLKRKNR